MKHSLFALIPLLMTLGSAVQAQDDVTGCFLIRIDQYYGLKEWDCRFPTVPFGSATSTRTSRANNALKA